MQVWRSASCNPVNALGNFSWANFLEPRKWMKMVKIGQETKAWASLFKEILCSTVQLHF